MKTTLKLLPVLIILMLLVTIAAPCAYANDEVASPDAEPTTTTTTTASTTAAPSTIPIKNFYIIGSNDKYYLCSPEMTDSVDSYSFNIPDWMESSTIYIKAASGLKVNADSIDFNEDNGVYRGKVKDITKASQSYTIKLESSSASRSLTIMIKRSNIPCYFDSVSMYKGDSAINSKGSITDGLTFNLPAGTTGGVTVRIKPRHENAVTVTNLTGIDNPTGSESKTTLDLNTRTMRYDYSPTLVEGANKFKFTVSAGNVSKDCYVNIIVGEEVTTTTTAATEAVAPVSDSSVIGGEDQIPTTAPTLLTTTPTEESSGSGGSKLSPVLWVLIGAIVTIIAGAIIFMIVNLSRRDDYDDYDGYDDYAPRPRSRGRRNLDDFVEDDYYDEGPRRGRGDYDDYDDGYSYDEESDRYSGRSQYRGEGGRSRRGGGRYDDYDDFGDNY